MRKKKNQFQVQCRPVLEDVICRMGQKCFHNIHYLCRTRSGVCIPADACPFEAVAANLYITSVARQGDCVRITGTYDVLVWFSMNNGQAVEQAERTGIPFKINVPLQNVGSSCQEIFCAEGLMFDTQVCAANLKLEVVEAVLEAEKTGEICPECGIRLKITVEKEFLAFEHGIHPIRVAQCLPELCVPKREGPAEAECPPFVKPTECVDSCLQNEVFNPNTCDRCPPPQGSLEPAASCTPCNEVVPQNIPTAPGAAKGRILDLEGKPLFRARIVASDGKKSFTARSNFNGSFLLPLYPDHYELTVVKRGYIAQTLNIALGSGEIKELQVALAPDLQDKGFRLKL